MLFMTKSKIVLDTIIVCNLVKVDFARHSLPAASLMSSPIRKEHDEYESKRIQDILVSL